jgi:hypothetical protein
MILVILHCADRTEYDRAGRIIEEKGTVTVSHGVDTVTGRTIILPCELWRDFRHNCINIGGEGYLK